MKMIDNRINDLAKGISESTLMEAMDSSIYLASNLVGLHKILLTTKECEEQGRNADEIAAVQLELLEEIDSFGGLKSIEFISKCRIFETDSLNDRMELVTLNLPSLLDEVETLTWAGVELSDSSVVNLRDVAKEILDSLIYCIYIGYGFANIKDKLDSDQDYEIQSYVIKTLEAKSLNVEDIVNFFAEMFLTYKPSLTVFEKAPEMEASFYSAAGVYIDVFVLNHEYLDIETVARVIEGEIAIEEIVYEFTEKVKKAKGE